MNVSSLLSSTAQATLLLTSYFTKNSDENVKPLTNTEWGRFALWLKERSITPADLLVTDPKTLLQNWHDVNISAERIIKLLNRGHSLALSMEKWQRAGLWVVTRSDPEYPWRLKQRLKTDSPPVLFGCGNKALLNSGGLAVIGSRNANSSDLDFTDQVGMKAAIENIAVISGGARGVDETAMLGAIKQGGIVIGVMADNLLKAATSKQWRNSIMEGHTVLLSPFYPESGFNVGNAMSRNKYIYCLADSSLVIHSGKKGGTLNGATENLKKAWVPLWVKQTTDQNAANADLVAKGGLWLENDLSAFEINQLIRYEYQSMDYIKEKQTELFPILTQSDLFDHHESESKKDILKTENHNVIIDDDQSKNEINTKQCIENDTKSMNTIDFYQLFISELQRLAKEPVTIDILMESTQLHKTQLNEWLKRSKEEGLVKKLHRPIRYQIKNESEK